MLPGPSKAPAQAAVWRTSSSMWRLRQRLLMSGVPWAMPFLWEPPAALDVFTIGNVDGDVRGEDHAHPVGYTVLSDFTYADDSCFCCVLRSNIDVASAVLGACVIVADVLLRPGMVVNWDRGKSAALVEIRGALSRSAKRELFLEHGT